MGWSVTRDEAAHGLAGQQADRPGMAGASFGFVVTLAVRLLTDVLVDLAFERSAVESCLTWRLAVMTGVLRDLSG